MLRAFLMYFYCSIASILICSLQAEIPSWMNFIFKSSNPSSATTGFPHTEKGPVVNSIASPGWIQFKPEESGLNLSETGIPAAFCDWYGSKHVDIISLHKGSSFTLYLSRFIAETRKYARPLLLYTFPSNVIQIHTVTAVDYDLDGAVDLAITYSTSPISYLLMILRQIPSKHTVLKVWDSESAQIPRSLVPLACMDINSDGYPDFVGETLDKTFILRDNAQLNIDINLKSKTEFRRFAWIYKQGAYVSKFFTDPEIRLTDEAGKMGSESRGQLPGLTPGHSSAFLDLNGDCIPDLVFDVVIGGKRFLEIWFADMALGIQAGVTYTKTDLLPLPQGSQQLSYADINGDGTLDIIYPVCNSFDDETKSCDDSSSQGLQIILNKQLPMCQEFIWVSFLKSGDIAKKCRQPKNICTASPITWETVPLMRLQEFIKDENNYAFFKDSSGVLGFKVGDIDLDGFPDLIFLLTHQQQKSIGILRNYLNNNEYSALAAGTTSLTDKTIFEFSVVPLEVTNAALMDQVALVDLEERNQLEFLVWGEKSKLTDRVASASGLILRQTVPSDNYFIKFSALNGACDIVCHRDNNSWPHYGAVAQGGTIKISAIDLHGNNFVRTVAFYPQSTYSSYPLPHILLGLSYVNNYIDYVFYGLPYANQNSKQEDGNNLINNSIVSNSTDVTAQTTHRWVSLIPNSFVIVNSNPRQNPSEWKLELSVSPSKMFWRTVFATIGFLALISMIIIFLDAQEKAEDLKEHQGFRKQYIATN